MTAALARLRGEDGAVLVMVGVWLPVLALFIMLAVDIAHWYDYSRNLQMRADAAALAGGNELGGTCFSSPSGTALGRIGQITQLYSGASDAVSGGSDLYPYTPVFGSGFPGSAAAPNNPNFPNLKLGQLSHYHVLLNSTRYWQPGDTSATQSFSMPGSNSPTPGDFCTTTDEDGNSGPIVDVRVTQDHLPLFLPFVTWRPTISAHARVALVQANAEGLVRAIAVRDPTPGCIFVKFVSTTTNYTKQIKLPLDGTGDPLNPSASLWDNRLSAGDDVDMSQGPFVVQVVNSDNDCSGAPSGTTYDASTNSGLEFVNTYGSALPAANGDPLITVSGMNDGTGGVFLTGCTSTPPGKWDQYFADAACTVGVTANVAFAVPFQGSCTNSNEIVTATNLDANNSTITLQRLCTQVHGNQNGIAAGGLLNVDSTAGFAPSGSINVGGTSYAYSAIADATHFRLVNGGSFTNNSAVVQAGDNRWTSGNGGLGITLESGRNRIQINWQQQTGTTSKGACTNSGQNPCQGNFGVQQQTFNACGDCDPPDDSGPVVAIRIRRQGEAAGTTGRNSFSNTTDPNLTIEVVTQAIRYDTPGTRDHLLRVSVTTDKATGLLNCGQGTGAQSGGDAVQFGCPVVNTAACKAFEYCAPYTIYDPSIHPLGTCNPLSRDTGSQFADCVATNSENGTKRAQIVGAIANRVVDAAGNCSANHWRDYVNNPSANPIQGDTDPRAVTLVITAPGDLSQNSLTIPIRNFATFYVTGWDAGGSVPQCQNNKLVGGTFGNDPFFCANGDPVNCVTDTGSKQNFLGSIWGHWIQYVDPNAFRNGPPTFCQPTQFGVCTPVLTR